MSSGPVYRSHHLYVRFHHRPLAVFGPAIREEARIASSDAFALSQQPAPPCPFSEVRCNARQVGLSATFDIYEKSSVVFRPNFCIFVLQNDQVRKPRDIGRQRCDHESMDLNHAACYRAICTRDVRFDGRLFTGVKTTGIYCRPVCPARTPRSENVTFYRSAAAAQEAGFRPCLRCRPETAPDLGAWRGTSNTVSRALALIELGALDEADVETFAQRLGVGARQLRRLFRRHLGASPIAVAQTRRVLLAKQLIHETRLPTSEIALAAGFGSIRRFNETFQQLFGRAPGAVRRSNAEEISAGASGEVTILLRYRPPYDWPAMLSYLQ
ncbi:MAG: bifunctional transcriptional activator/DNA repair enzyme AdaA, partial [Methylocella sp.]